jgi:hypothetical protein
MIVPVGVLPEEQFTVALNVMFWPGRAGFTDEVRVVVEGDTPLPDRATVRRLLLVLLEMFKLPLR